MLIVQNRLPAARCQRTSSPMERVDERPGGQPRFLAQALAWVEYRHLTLERLRRELAAGTAEEVGAAGSGGEG